MKNHEKGNHCKTLNKAFVNECSFQKEQLEKLKQKEKLTKLVEIYKINSNGDSNFNLEEVKGEPTYRFKNLFKTSLSFFDWNELPPFEYERPTK